MTLKKMIMAKKKIDKDITDAFKGARKEAGVKSGPKCDGGNVKNADEILLDKLFDIFSEYCGDIPDIPGVSKEDKVKLMLTTLFVKLGVTPEEYSELYEIITKVMGIVDDIEDAWDASDETDEFSMPFGMHGLRRDSVPFNTYVPMADAEEKTLVLKIQMKDVVKAPMWREVEVPADFDFLKLHKVIQTVTGLENCHLWQFNRSAYDDSLQIGIPMDEKDPYSYGLDYITDNAETTPLTKYLAQKGDELEYVYDFGDDWIFTIKVQKVLDKGTDTAKCIKWKSDLNAIEDFGGRYSYIDLRELVSDDSEMTKKEKDELAKHYMDWFESKKDLMNFLKKSLFNADDVTVRLQKI